MGKGRDASSTGQTPEGSLDEWISNLKSTNFETPLNLLASGLGMYRNKMVLDAAEAAPLRDADDRSQDAASLNVMIVQLRALADEAETVVALLPLPA